MIGWRIIKTGIAVALCIWIAQLLKFEYPFYSAIAAVIAMQATIEGSWKTGVHRMQGTIVGALTGYIFALVAVRSPWWTGLGLILTMTILKFMKWHEAISIASVVFILVQVLNRSYSFLSLITNPTEYSAIGAYEETCGILEKVRIKVIKDRDGTYVGPNKQYILELLDWSEKLIEATSGCLRLSP